MKRWGLAAALMFLLAAIIIGCRADSKEIQQNFAPLLEGKATPDSIRIAAEYLDENIGKADQETASLMVVAYEDYLIKYLNNDADWAQIELLTPFWNFETDQMEADKIETEEARKVYEDLTAGGFKFISLEGMINPIVDYRVFGEKYGSRVTEALSDLYLIKQSESDQPMGEDAALMISWDELAMRAYAVEQYIETYREDQLTIADAQFMYENYINTMLLGMNNTPIFDYEMHQFSKDAKTAYTRFVEEHPNSVTSWMLKEFDAYLASVGYVMDYQDENQSKAFFDTCNWLVSETGARVME